MFGKDESSPCGGIGRQEASQRHRSIALGGGEVNGFSRVRPTIRMVVVCAPKEQTIPAQGNALGTAGPGFRALKGRTRPRGDGRDSTPFQGETMGFGLASQGVALGWYSTHLRCAERDRKGARIRKRAACGYGSRSRGFFTIAPPGLPPRWRRYKGKNKEVTGPGRGACGPPARPSRGCCRAWGRSPRRCRSACPSSRESRPPCPIRRRRRGRRHR